MYVLFVNGRCQERALQSQSLSRQEAQQNSDAFGLALHLDPRLSRPVLDTDVQLLHALSMLVGSKAAFRNVQYELQTHVLDGWARVDPVLPCMQQRRV